MPFDPTRTAVQAPSQQLPSGHVLGWGLCAAPLFLMMLTALAKTPWARLDDPDGTFWATWMAGSLAGVIIGAIASGSLPRREGRRERARRITIAGWAFAVALEIAWVALYAVDATAPALLTRLATLVVSLTTAGLFAIWVRESRALTPIETFAEFAVALMSAFILFSLVSILQQPLIASYAYPVVIALTLTVYVRRWDAPAPSGERECQAGAPIAAEASAAIVAPGFGRGNAGKEADAAGPAPAQGMSQRAVRTRGSIGLPALAATLLLAALLGAGLAVTSPAAPQPGMFCALGIAAIVLATPFFPHVPADRLVILIWGPLALIGVCLGIVLSDSGAPLALLLAGGGSLVVWTIAHVRASGSTELGRLSDPGAVLVLVGLAALVGLLGMQALASGLPIGLASQGVLVVTALCTAQAIWLGAVGPVVMEGLDGMGSATAPNGATGEGDQAARDASHGVVLLATTYELSPREAEVALLLAEDRSIRDICEELNLAVSTVKTHVAHVYEKAGVHSKGELQELVAQLAHGEAAE